MKRAFVVSGATLVEHAVTVRESFERVAEAALAHSATSPEFGEAQRDTFTTMRAVPSGAEVSVLRLVALELALDLIRERTKVRS